MTGIATTMTELQDIQFSLPILSSHQTPTVKDGPKLPAYALERDSNRFPGFTSLSTNYPSTVRCQAAPGLPHPSQEQVEADVSESILGHHNEGTRIPDPGLHQRM